MASTPLGRRRALNRGTRSIPSRGFRNGLGAVSSGPYSMPMTRRIFSLLLPLLCPAVLSAQVLVDPKATAETKALFSNLKASATKGIMFGHQDGDGYGVGWRNGKGKPDVFRITGDHPAVHGWDLGKIEHAAAMNLDSVNFRNMRRWIIRNYRRGGINTVSWHIDNPVSGGSAWDKTPAVKDILPGGSKHELFLQELNRLADFMNGLQSGGSPVPIIFRPWHEHNGDWFWWGKGNCTEAEYIALWRFTVHHLRDTRNLHHLLYAFSPDRSRMDLTDARGAYTYGYPGDGYVDVIGLDDYQDAGFCETAADRQKKNDDLVKVLRTITAIAAEKNKVAALTETGQEGIREDRWFTGVMLEPIRTAGDIRIAFMVVWRNANRKHHYAPYPGHPSVPDFLNYYNAPLTLFESDLSGIYKTSKSDRP